MGYNWFMEKMDIAGLKVNAVTKREFLAQCLARVKAGEKTFVITPYSEFLYRAFKNPSLLEIFNAADFSLADGIGIFWAKKYLGLPLTAKSFYGKILQSLWQMFYSLAAIIFYPAWIKLALPEKIVGADLVWDLARLAANNNLSIYLLGGFGDTAKIAAHQLTAVTKNDGRHLSERLKIAGWSNKNPDDLSVMKDINKSSADILFVAYGPVKQEKWIAENLKNLNVKLAIGVGGSFDYIAGVKSAPPKIIRYSGLEWLWRLVTQPYRFKRIVNATFGLMTYLTRYKVFMSYPYRKNVVSIILNSKNEVLICRRNPNNPQDILYGFQKNDMVNYWQFTQGGIDDGETIEQTAKREILEELGVTNIESVKISDKTHYYLFPNQNRRLLYKQGHYKKGQEQSIIYFRFRGSDNSIKVDNMEFIDYKWVPLERLVEEVHEHRKKVALIVQEDLKDLA